LTSFSIHRNHSIEFLEIRNIAFSWAEYLESEYRMICIYEEGDFEDLINFSKPGVHGELLVAHTNLKLNVHLGILLSPFSKKIEKQIISNLDLFLNN